MKNLEFNIEKSTIRELTTHEVNEVAGATAGITPPISLTIDIYSD